MKLCDYGCGQEAKYKFKNGKWCCSKFHSQCPELRRKNSENNSCYWTGKKRTDMSEIMKGRNNPMWRRNKDRTYCSVWEDQEFKDSIKERDGNKCLNPECSKYHNIKLNLHHINYIKGDCNPNNLITLCISCHGKSNKDRDWHQSWYEAIIYRRYNFN